MAKKGAPYGNKNAVGPHNGVGGVGGALSGAVIGGILGAKSTPGNLSKDISRANWGVKAALVGWGVGGPTGLLTEQILKNRAKNRLINTAVKGLAGAATGAVVGGWLGARRRQP